MTQKRVANREGAKDPAAIGVEAIRDWQALIAKMGVEFAQGRLPRWPGQANQLPDIVNANRLFAPADFEATAGYGKRIAHDMPAYGIDPASAAAFWSEIYAAWFQLWMPSLDALQQGRPIEDPRPIDIFLSHSRKDESRVRQLREHLDALGTVRSFVDWIDAPLRDRTEVGAETAEWLRNEMRRSKTLVLLLSEQSANSFWVQWELGFFDALRGYVFLVPLDDAARAAVVHQEYHQLYPMIESTDELVGLLKAHLRPETA